VYIYIADQNGKVISDESFRQPYRLERSESADEAQETFDLLYDHLNDTINWPTAGD
jgi:hypothetical protein